MNKKKMGLFLLVSFCFLNNIDAMFFDKNAESIVRKDSGQLVLSDDYDVNQENQAGEDGKIIKAVPDDSSEDAKEKLGNKSEDSFELVEDFNDYLASNREVCKENFENWSEGLQEIKLCHDKYANKASEVNMYKNDSCNKLKQELSNWSNKLKEIKTGYDEDPNELEGYRRFNIRTQVR